MTESLPAFLFAVDPADGLIVGEVGPWAAEKHDRMRKYIDASSGRAVARD